MSNFEFNAPQFVNFSDEEDPKADRFFDTNQEHDRGSKNQVIRSTTKTKEAMGYGLENSENQVPSSAIKSKEPAGSKKNFTVLRKVLHEIVNHQIHSDKNIPNTQCKDQGKDIVQQFEKLQLSEVKTKKSRGPLKATELLSGVKFPGSEKKAHPMMTRLDAANHRSSSRPPQGSPHSEDASVHIVGSGSSHGVKTTALKRNGSPLNCAKKFISLAEQVEHFYKDTPDRYRSKPTAQTTSISKTWTAKSNCVPKTPNLTTKYRRRKISFPDENQREEMELEEMKKHQIKAHPLNKKILMGPSLNLKVPIAKKPVTVPQPFSLTEVKKKEPPPEPVFQFKAQPVPTSILTGPVGIPPKRVVSPTVPITPQIKVPSRLRVEVKSPEKRNNEGFCLPRNTKVEPFSFDVRMRDFLQKKEESVRKVIEEEKKGFSSFKANPMPDFGMINEHPPNAKKSLHKTVAQPLNLTQVKGSNKSFSEDSCVIRVLPFKARTASVVHQKPFLPKLQKHEVQLPLDFHLNTEKRAAERQKFDEKLKQKEDEIALILKLQKNEGERLEKERMLEERKKTEFKAAPMPRYKTFEIHGADPDKLTQPQSPKFSSKTRKTHA